MITLLNKIFKENQKVTMRSPSYKLIFLYFYIAHFYNIKDFFTLRFLSYTGEYSNLACPPYFKYCNYFTIKDLPESYSYTFFILIILCSYTFSIYFYLKKNFAKATLCILPLLTIEFLQATFLVSFISMPFEYFSTYLFLVFILSKNKIENLKFMLVLFYILAGLTKITPAWILAEYMNNLTLGFPLIPKAWNLVAANTVIIFELFFVNFLFSLKFKKIKFLTFLFFLIFHLYSYLIVGLRYPLYCLPLLCILYFDKTQTKVFKCSIYIKVLGFLFILINTFHFIIPGDHRITYEASKLTLNMFDGSRQSITTITPKDKNSIKIINNKAYSRYSAYHAFKDAQRYCISNEMVSLSFTVSIDREPFYQIINEENICNKEFKSFSHNYWINVENPKLIGYPSENFYRKNFSNKGLISSKPLKFNKPILYDFVSSYFLEFKIFYYIIFILSILKLFFPNLLPGKSNQ